MYYIHFICNNEQMMYIYFIFIVRSKWLPEVRHYIPDAHVVLLGLKSDLKDTARNIVTYDEGYQLAKEEGT